jgi:murein DD-endopeptidase / murein LD-carboxypeptidase
MRQYRFSFTNSTVAALLFLLNVCGCSTCKKSTGADKYKGRVISYPKNDSAAVNGSTKKNYHKLQIEFGKKLAVAPDSIFNLRLYGFIKRWLGTPYLWGGTNASGIDCSAFVQQLYQSVYDIDIPRTSIEQFYAKWVDLYSDTKYLKEGDLVFFKTMNNYNAVTHVGFYLHNGYFVNASSSKGVSIASLYDSYWSVKYVASGRLKRKYFAGRNNDYLPVPR